MKTDIDNTKIEINKLRAALNRKRNVIHNREESLINLKIFEDSYLTLKKMYKDKIKEYDNKFHKISMDISAQTGITENIALFVIVFLITSFSMPISFALFIALLINSIDCNTTTRTVKPASINNMLLLAISKYFIVLFSLFFLVNA